MLHRRPTPSVRNSPNLPTTFSPSNRVTVVINEVTPPPNATVLIVVPNRQTNHTMKPARNRHSEARELERSSAVRQSARAASHKHDDHPFLRSSETARPSAMMAPSPIKVPV